MKYFNLTFRFWLLEMNEKTLLFEGTKCSCEDSRVNERRAIEKREQSHSNAFPRGQRDPNPEEIKQWCET